MYVCVCFALREKDLENIILSKRCSTIQDLERHTNAGSSCGSCLIDIESKLTRLKAEMPRIQSRCQGGAQGSDDGSKD